MTQGSLGSGLPGLEADNPGPLGDSRVRTKLQERPGDLVRAA